MTGKILLRGGVVATIFLIVIVMLGWSSVETGAGPPLDEITITPLSPPTPPEPTPPPTETPEPPATEIPKPTSTPDPAIEVTANYKVRRCLLYAEIPERWIVMEKAPKDQFNNLTLDDVPLVLAVMAAESGCDPHLTSTDGYASIGLMQIIPRDWLPNVRSNGMNVYTGMYILDRSIDLAYGDVRLALAYYNCGVPKVEADACGSHGGLNYADKVLDFWLPRFPEAVEYDSP
jgi:hypothetical protein